jgi:hypothetical protein
MASDSFFAVSRHHEQSQGANCQGYACPRNGPAHRPAGGLLNRASFIVRARMVNTVHQADSHTADTEAKRSDKQANFFLERWLHEIE